MPQAARDLLSWSQAMAAPRPAASDLPDRCRSADPVRVVAEMVQRTPWALSGWSCAEVVVDSLAWVGSWSLSLSHSANWIGQR